MVTRVYLEEGQRRTFACAVDWPGWCRAGRTPDAAVSALADYAGRFAPVAAAAGLTLPDDAGDDLEVVERVPGNATTDFGAPGVVPQIDAEALTPSEAARHAAIVAAAWETLDNVAAGAPPELRKGPRGGGRDRDAIVEHVVEAERSYARKIGIRHKPFPDRAALVTMRKEVVAVLTGATAGEPLAPKGWPPRYASRRIAWHVLDHAWEIEDRSDPA